MAAKMVNEQTLATKREQYRDALGNAVQRIATALAQKPEVERAILFGSYARGRRDLFTDLDVLIVMDSPLDFVSRTAEMYRDLSCPVDLDLLVYTPEELARNRDRGFIRRVLEEGKVIYEKRAA
jgi:predicted nucleotidyltransferase